MDDAANVTRKSGEYRSLTRAVYKEAHRLNPDWVEWLMGWPVGWTRSDEAPDEYAQPVTEWWVVEPPHVPRIVDKTAKFSQRIRCIGNGQVPLCAATAFYILTEVL